MRSISRFISGAVLGSAVAAVLVLLFTPKSGPQLRDRVRGEIRSFADEIKLASEQKRVELEEELARLKAG